MNASANSALILQSSASTFPNCIDSAVCFSLLWVLMKPKLRLRSAKPSESHESRNRFRKRNAQKQLTQNTAGKKRTRQEDVDSDYLFIDAKKEIPK